MSIASAVRRGLEWGLPQFVFYPDRNDRMLQPEPRLMQRLVVMRSQDYDETTAFYQVEDESELKKIIKLELQDSGAPALFAIGELMDGRRQVCFFYLKDSIKAALHPWLPTFLVPESWLIRQYFPEQLVSFDAQETQLWVLSYRGLTASVQAQGLMTQASVVCTAVGVPQLDIVRLNRIELHQQILANPSVLVQRQLAGFFFHDPQNKIDEQSWAMGGLVAASVFSLTVFLYGKVLDIQTGWAEQKQLELTVQVGPLLELQKRVEQAANDIELLQGLETSTAKMDYAVWRALFPLFKQTDLQVNKVLVSAAANTYTLYGKAPKATQVLQLLSQQPGVRSASFLMDVISRDGIEQFVIRFSMES